MIVRFNRSALSATHSDPIGVEGDPPSTLGKISEAEKLVNDAKKKVLDEGVPGIGVSGSNSGKGHDPVPISEQERETVFKAEMERVVEEEPGLVEGREAPELALEGTKAAKVQSEETAMNLKLSEGAAKNA
jgi:protein phosphatase PTC1